MIQTVTGNLLDADAEALVNTVNTVGVMGRGIALQFKRAFPENFRAYAQACKAGEVVPGRMFIHTTGAAANPKYIINFPTKRHWRSNSKLEDIEAGLAALAAAVQRLGIRSIAIPPLGCGLGGLDWGDVRPMIEGAFAELPDVAVDLYEPGGAPSADSQPIRSPRPRMTRARAMYIKLMEFYAQPGYPLTALEFQKLAYLLQASGEPLGLRFQQHIYGPYADQLNHVLEAMEGHFVRGHTGERSPTVELRLLPGVVEEATAFLASFDDAHAHLRRVARLIEGFETPYGLELLASVHWLASRNPPVTTADEATDALHAWSTRKRRMFPESHVAVAWNQLRSAAQPSPSVS
jgi:O-acetyl-ADP-ribose deacetylase (regulator of RNase III)